MTSTRPPVYNGRYELQSQVARGGTAQVYLARDIILGRSVALKVLFPELSTDHTFVERFRREAQAAASLSQPNIVPVFDWGESDRTYFIVMEYVDGEPLSSIIHTQAPLAPGNAAQVAADIAKALSYAHRHGVVHRDVKPGNVLITSDGQVKVTDFGIARAVGGVDEQVTQTGLVMGTATYFSPEQAQGLDVDGRSDIYSLGVVLYEMLTGRPPFAGDTPVAIAYQHVQETPPRPRTLNPDIPPALEAIVMQAMAKLPAERYQAADELRADLERFLRNQTVLATPPSEFVTASTPAAPPTELLTRATAAYGMDTTAIPTAAAYEPPKIRRTTPYWITAAVVLLVAIVIVGVIGARSLGYLGGTKYVRVPYVVHDTTAVAESTLKGDGFKYTTKTEKTTNPSNSGKVLKTSPEFPTSVKQGSTVTLYVGGNVPQVPLPSVVGETYSAASSKLKSLKFDVKKSTVPYTVGSKAGTVTTENPAGGSTQIQGTSVTLGVIGTPTTVAVPTWTKDESPEQAGEAIGAANLQFGTTRAIFSSTVPSGDVISSDPASGTVVAQGTTINLVLSRGAGVAVPNVVGMTLGQATSALQAVDLQITTIEQPEPSQLDGYVISQKQAVGTLLDAGNVVTVTVGELAAGNTGTTTTTTTLPVGNTGTTTTTVASSSGGATPST